MNPLTIAVSALFGALALMHFLLWLAVRREILKPPRPLLTDDECPPGLVVLCLRGGDLFLERSLRLLFTQDYPRYRVRIVLDASDDAARPYVERVLAELQPGHVEVMSLGERHRTCTYKMSGILWGTRDLPEDVAFVALMDGDAVPHPSWLRTLATPLVRGEALCSTGNRWYVPSEPTLPSMVRMFWGAGALSLMTLFRIPWGGTMAFRREVIQDARLRDRIRHAFSEDTTIGQFVHDLGGRVDFDARLILLNSEPISMGSFFGFDMRQLLAVKLQHRCWPWMALYGLTGLAIPGYPLLRPFVAGLSYVTDAWFVTYVLAMFLQSLLIGLNVRRLAQRRGETMPTWGPRRILLGLLATPTVQIVHLFALARALLTRTVVWRGVHYRLGGATPLEVVRDESAETPPSPPQLVGAA